MAIAAFMRTRGPVEPVFKNGDFYPGKPHPDIYRTSEGDEQLADYFDKIARQYAGLSIEDATLIADPSRP